MASSFKNAGLTVTNSDTSASNLYTAPGGGAGAVIHAVYISNKDSVQNANVDIKVTTDGGSTFYYIGKSLKVEPENTLVLDKPINLEPNDIIRVTQEYLPDSSLLDVEAFASILEVT